MVTALPDGFRFGVTIAGYPSEGGLNGPGQPANNWQAWEGDGRVPRSGEATGFWDDFEHHLDRAVAAGCDAVRLPVEWARCEPSEGEIDRGALDRYGAILDGCRQRGLEPAVALHQFSHPAWLGPSFWLDLEAPDRFVRWARVVVEHLGERCQRWTTIAQINLLALRTWLFGSFPPGERLAIGPVIRALDAMLAAHVGAYAAIHALQPGAAVATSTAALTVYELDRLLLDLLLAPSLGIGRDDLGEWLASRRDEWHRSWPPSLAQSAARRVSASAVPLEQALPRATGAVYNLGGARPADLTEVANVADLINVSNVANVANVAGPGARSRLAVRLGAGVLVGQLPSAERLLRHLQLPAASGLPVEVLQEGGGRDQPDHLREHVAAVIAAVDAGADVRAYFHHTLVDCYEWGSYERRTGLYGMDRTAGLAWQARDAMGDDAAGAYRRLIQGLRAGDRSVLRG